MDLSDINWDFEASGSWPLQVKAAIIFLLCCLVAGGGVYAFTLDQFAELEKLEAEETQLFTTFEQKQRKAVNLVDYRAQFKEIEGLLAGMMKQMPTKAEVANLLNEISLTAVTSGLEPNLFQPEAEVRKEFYVELPYSIEMAGKYEELGLFIGGLASLSRIVTVHDIQMSSAKDKEKPDLLVMKATIKTYNEASDEDQANDKKSKKAKSSTSKDKDKNKEKGK